MKSKSKKDSNFFVRLGKFFSYCILGILVFVCFFFAFYIIENTYAKATGKKPIVSMYVIVSPSMVPTINVYDMIIDTGVTKDKDVKLNDIVTFYSTVINTGGYTITHRINTINNESNETRYVTKGDNNSSVDVGFTTVDNIVGKVRLIIPKIGNIQRLLTSKWGWLLVVLIPTVAILLSDIYKLISLLRIKNELVDIPDLGNFSHEKELESNKNLRVLVEKANKLENEKEEKNEKGESTK